MVDLKDEVKHSLSEVVGSKNATSSVPPDVTDTSQCKICNEIWNGLVGCTACDTQNNTITVGSFEKALSSTCSRHTSLVGWFEKLVKKRSNQTYDRSWVVNIYFHRQGVIVLYLNKFSTSSGVFANLCLVRKESIDNHPGVSRVLDLEWIDTTVVDRWLKRCKSCHGASCENPMRIWRTRPAWVVDTETKRLIPGEECDSFIVLSYRWGGAMGLHISGDAISRLQMPYALDDPAVSSQLAPMVRHAIELTPVIGQRYLWVDTLCIDHSRVAESTKELERMGAIYANATLTIVALDGDAQDGFPGLRGISHAKKGEESRYATFGGEQFIEDTVVMDDSPYFTRGWTYQEFRLSPRRLIFSNNSLRWHCQRGICEEPIHDDANPRRHFEPYLSEIMRGMPSLDALCMLIDSYNRRKFAYDEDTMPGVAGLLTICSRCFSGGFLCGIPEMMFEAALRWKPRCDTVNLRRRTPSDRPDSSRLHPCHLPSWSWIGWEGSVDIGKGEAGIARIYNYWIKETIPTTVWYASNSPKPSENKRKIQNSWFKDRKTYKDFERPLPAGWTRHAVPTVGQQAETNGEVLLYPEGCERYTFRYGSAPEGQEEDEWYWPFPVPDIQESTMPFMPEQSPYICCDTQRCRVFASQKPEEYRGVNLYNDQKIVIGSLDVHNEEQLQEFPESDASSAPAKEVELVAICRVRHHSKTLDKETRLTHPLESWDTYVVLWVEWSDGVAYRLASGEVHKEAWEKLALEDVALVLG